MIFRGRGARTNRGIALGVAALVAGLTAVVPGPASAAVLLSDGFETGSFSAWSTVLTGGAGTAVVQSSIVRSGSFAAQFSSTATPESFAYARSDLPTAQADLTVTGAFRVETEGAAGGNVPLIRLFDAAGVRTVSLYRQNQSGDRLWVSYNGTRNETTGTLGLATWGSLSLHVTASNVEVSLDGTSIFQSANASLPPVAKVQLASDSKATAYSLVVDDVSVDGNAPVDSPPANSSAPTITGSPAKDQTLTASDGTWTGTQPITYAYQWRRCNSGGTGCADVAGATAGTYVLTSADITYTLRVTVTASNSVGTASASSAQTAIVTGTSTPVIAGFRDFPITGTSAPTGQKPQSKLWFNDGTWWGVLFNPGAGQFRIHRFNQPSQSWTDTGVVVDTRKQVYSDALWDGSRLYVATAGDPSPTLDRRVRVMRFTYNTANDTYSADAGFPVTISTTGVELVVLDKDSTGRLWATFTQGSQVKVTHTSTADNLWVAAYGLPVGTPANVTADDVSTVIKYDGNKIGVMWGNQLNGTYYFATHNDGSSDQAWTLATAYSCPECADDHMSVRSVQGDSAGRVFAVVKTSLNSPGDPLTVLLWLNSKGKWKNRVVGTVADDLTRAIVQVDPTNRKLYVFAASPCCNGGTIYMKSSPLDTISFAPGKGTPFIQSATDVNINNPSATKRNLNSTTDVVVLAGDDTTHFYLHNTLNL
jgi:hypothetical protein